MSGEATPHSLNKWCRISGASCWEEVSEFVLPDFITTSLSDLKKEASIEDFDEDNL